MQKFYYVICNDKHWNMSAHQILQSLEPQQQRILLNPANSKETKTALLTGLHVTPDNTIALLNYLQGQANPVDTTHPSEHVVTAPTMAPVPAPGLEYNADSMKRVAELLGPSLAGGGNPTVDSITKMEETMDTLLKNLTKGPLLSGGGGHRLNTHAVIMQNVLRPSQFTTWSNGGKIHVPVDRGGQRRMLLELSRGALLSKLVSRDQLRTMAFGKVPPITTKQREVGVQALFPTDGRPSPLMLWGAKMMYPPSHDITHASLNIK